MRHSSRCQVPYFELVAELGARKLEIAAEREHLVANIRECQVQIGRVEHDVQVSQKKLKLDEIDGREVERSLRALLEDLEATLVQCAERRARCCEGKGAGAAQDSGRSTSEG